jgi:importin subunit beta-1
MDLTPFLGALNNPDDATRNAAEMQLKQAEESNYEMFLMGLCVELATEAKDSANRRQAGLYLKNLFTAQDNAIKQAKLAKWGACQPHTKEQFRLGLLQAMASQDLHAAHTAAQATAALASIEVPTNEWPTLLPTLLNNVQDDKVPAITKVASLDALGSFCFILIPFVSFILTSFCLISSHLISSHNFIIQDTCVKKWILMIAINQLSIRFFIR